MRAAALLLPLLLIPVLLMSCDRIEATIRSYSPDDPENPVQVNPGDAVTLSVTVANTGNRAHGFIVKATIWNASGIKVKEYEAPLDPPLKPSEERTVTWTHTVEHEGEYWLQFSVWKDENTPLDQRPQTSRKLIVAAVPQPVSSKFELGERVRVMERLKVREGPGLDKPEVEDPDYPGAMPVGSLGNVLEGPVSADGHVWWKVEFDRGVTGWCAEEYMESLAVLLGKKPASP